MHLASPLLTNYNTFKISAKARSIYELTSIKDLRLFLESHISEPFLILGQGSNVLFTNNYPYDVALIRWLGKQVEILSETDAILIAAAGEPWHELVMWSLHQKLGGLENLALIPGSVGAAPIQNIGAYGIELKDVFHWCKAIHRVTLEERLFTFDECEFGYRDSVFKKALKDQYVITEVAFKLSRNNHPINIEYAPLQQWFSEKKPNRAIDPLEVAEAVCAIRAAKLPDPKIIGNAGSFFKNPLISAAQAKVLREQFQNPPLYPQLDQNFKVAAGWLIDRLNLKGFKLGKAAIHDKQALVLVNNGGASGHEILALSQHIKHRVAETYGIELEEEVTIY